MFSLLITVVLIVWAVGIPWFWYLQSKSRDIVTVTATDRFFAIFWLPAYLATISFMPIAQAWNRRKKPR